MKYVKLTAKQKFSHYLVPITMAFFALIPFYFFITIQTNQYLTLLNTILASSFFFLFALYAFIVQKKALRFYSLNTNNREAKNGEIIVTILSENGWHVIKNEKNIIQATGHGFRHKLDLRTWSELMTFQLNATEIKVNSICNPNDRAQFISFGKNKQNIADFEILYLKYFAG